MYFITLERKIQIASPYQIPRKKIRAIPVICTHSHKLPLFTAELGVSVLDEGVKEVVMEVGDGIVVIVPGSDVMTVCDAVEVVPVTVVCGIVEDRVILLVELPELGSDDRGRSGS